MRRAGRSRNRSIEPSGCLLKPRQCFFRLVFEQIDERDRRLFTRSSFAIGFEPMPVIRANRQSFREDLREFDRVNLAEVVLTRSSNGHSTKRRKIWHRGSDRGLPLGYQTQAAMRELLNLAAWRER